MTRRFPATPPNAKAMLATRPSAEARALLALRRSAGKTTLGAPGPSEEALAELLAVAARVPDHRRLEPWRYIVFRGDARQAFGDLIAKIYHHNNPDADATALQTEAARPLRAPVIVAVISSPDKAHKTPVWEQELSAGAVCQTLLLAANASGWAGVWLTEWMAYDRDVAQALELTEDERIAGFIYLGTANCDPPERPRADMVEKISVFPAQSK